MQHQIANIATKMELARVMIYNTARKKEHGLNVVKEAAMVKLFASEVRPNALDGN